MALKYTVENLDGLDASVAGLYKQTDTGYQLDVEGVAAKTKVDEFRNNNVELTNKMTAIEAKLNGLDLEQFNTMFQSVQKMAQAGGDTEMKDALEQGEEAVRALIENRAEARSAAMKTDFDTRYAERDQAANKLRSQLEDAKITAELTRIAAEKGVRATAVDDVLHRGRLVFKLDDAGDVVAMKGDEVMFNKDNQPLTMNEYVTDLALSAPHLFQTSTGGDASNQHKSTGGASAGTFTYRGKEQSFQKKP